MRATRQASLQVEPIEARVLLSTAASVRHAAAAEVSPLIYPPPLLVTGEARGMALVRRGVPDVGDHYTLRGTGRVGPLGLVNVQGTIQTTSLNGQPIGSVTLSNRYGVVEMRITGRAGANGGAQPGSFNFEVTRATGRHANLAGTGGVIELAVGNAGRNGLANFRMGINPVVILSR